MEAARKGYTEIVDELAGRGADLNMRTVRTKLTTLYCHIKVIQQEAGESAIHAATVKGHVDVVRVLAHYGVDLNMPNKVYTVHTCHCSCG